MDFKNLFQDDREEWIINNEVKKKKELITKLEFESKYKLYTDSYQMLLHDFDSFKYNLLINKKIKTHSLYNMISFFSIKEEYERCTILQQLLIELN